MKLQDLLNEAKTIDVKDFGNLVEDPLSGDVTGSFRTRKFSFVSGKGMKIPTDEFLKHIGDKKAFNVASRTRVVEVYQAYYKGSKIIFLTTNIGQYVDKAYLRKNKKEWLEMSKKAGADLSAGRYGRLD